MSDDQTFNAPKLAINRVYTKKGDAGETRLVGGQKVLKDNDRIEAYGTIDELNSFIGTARQTILDQHVEHGELMGLARILLRIQHELFNLGSILATLPEDVVEYMPRVKQQDIDALESEIDVYNEGLPALRSFVLPGGTMLNAQLHQCRTICRRAERLLVRMSQQENVDALALAYVNRLSDAFFVWSRWASHVCHAREVLWQPNSASSATT
jgi:cob(I)alamin adenosyltransferase